MNTSDKFEFNTGFQWDIIKYTLTEPTGYKALLLYKASYFDMLEQQAIVKAMERYYKKRNRVPGSYAVMLEELKPIFKSKDFVSTLKDRDRERIRKKAKSLYKTGIKDSEEIMEAIVNFASYIKVRDLMSNFNVAEYDSYAAISTKLQAAVNTKRELDVKKGAFLVAGVRGRIARRKFQESVLPTPFIQLNHTTNAGGYTKGSVMVILDKQKGGKTLGLVNVARGYLSKLRKKVAIIDFENGQEAYEDRMDQSILQVTKRDLLDADATMEGKLKKMYRKFNRLGGDLYIERLPAGSTFNDVGEVLERLKSDHGFIPEVLVMDYLILMSPLKNKGSTHEDTSQVYIDAKDFAKRWELDCIWTANHINREAHKRRATRYESTDAAKALDIGRHADLIIGINQTHDEANNDILRMEIVDQRDGKGEGACYFSVNHAHQHLKEFTHDMIREYREAVGSHEDNAPAPDALSE